MLLLTIRNQSAFDFDEILRLSIGFPLCSIWFVLGLFMVIIHPPRRSSLELLLADEEKSCSLANHHDLRVLIVHSNLSFALVELFGQSFPVRHR